VRLRVIDKGVGIPPEVQAHLFEPFFTTKDVGKGSGLGLASVYGMVRQSNGFISVVSEPERGSAFSMHFPAVGASASTVHGNALQPVRSAGRGTILLVEDEDAVRVIVGAALRRHGFHVLEAATPLGACEVFREHAHEIALLLTDVIMPDMNGPALARRLTAKRPGLRVLFISGYADVAPIDGSDRTSAFSANRSGVCADQSRLQALAGARGSS
jgi:CheY-like chemotaxis protein